MLRHLAETSTTTWLQFSLCRYWQTTIRWRHFRYRPQLRRSSSTCLRPPTATTHKVIVSLHFTHNTWNPVFRPTGSTTDSLSSTGTPTHTLLTVMTGSSIGRIIILNSTLAQGRRPGIVGGLSVITRTLPPRPPELRPLLAMERMRSASLRRCRRRRPIATRVTASINGHLLTSRSPTLTR